MKIRRKIFIGSLIITFIAIVMHLFCTQKTLYYKTSSYDNQYDLHFLEYNFSKYLNSKISAYGKILLLDNNQNKTIATSSFKNISNINIEWAPNYVHIMRVKSFRLPNKLDIDSIDEKYKFLESQESLVDNYFDINKDGLLDKFGFAHNNDIGSFIVIWKIRIK